jgi:hypothetical protein
MNPESLVRNKIRGGSSFENSFFKRFLGKIRAGGIFIHACTQVWTATGSMMHIYE